jgi:TadE-like protein
LKTLRQNFRKALGDTGGSQIAEAAFVLPLLFMVLLGIMSFGRAFNVYSTITRAAQDGAALAALSSCGSCGVPVVSDAPIASKVSSVLEASKVDPSKIGTYILSPEPAACAAAILPGSCTTDSTSKLRICRNVQLNSTSPGPKQCGAIVSFQYPYQFHIPFASINVATIQMTAVAEQQMEN